MFLSRLSYNSSKPRTWWRFQNWLLNFWHHFGLNNLRYKSITLIWIEYAMLVYKIKASFLKTFSQKRISTRTFTTVAYLLRSQMIQWPVQSADTITLYSVDIFSDVIAEWWPVSVASKPVHIKPFVYKTARLWEWIYRNARRDFCLNSSYGQLLTQLKSYHNITPLHTLSFVYQFLMAPRYDKHSTEYWCVE